MSSARVGRPRRREEQDEFAAATQQKPEQAVADGIFAEEIVPIKGGVRLVDQDKHPRAGTTAEALGKLRAAFRDGGTVTAANASGINDGAAIVLISATKANERGLRTFGTVESYASLGVDPRIMGIGPVPAVRKALGGRGSSSATSTCSSLTRRSPPSRSPCSGN